MQDGIRVSRSDVVCVEGVLDDRWRGTITQWKQGVCVKKAVEGVSQGDSQHGQCRQVVVLMAEQGVIQVIEVVDGSVAN